MGVMHMVNIIMYLGLLIYIQSYPQRIILQRRLSKFYLVVSLENSLILKISALLIITRTAGATFAENPQIKIKILKKQKHGDLSRF